MALGRQRNHAHTPAMLLSNSLACDTHVKRDATILITSADHLVALCAEHSLPYWAAVGEHCGLCLSRLGHSDEAIARAMAALADYQATGSVTVVPMLLTFIAEALHSARRSNEGVEKLDEAIRQIEATGERWTESDTHRVRGDPLVAVGETVAAERSFHQAIGAALDRTQNCSNCAGPPVSPACA